MLRLRCGMLAVAGGSRLVGGSIRSQEPFVPFDCGSLEQRPPTQRQDPSTSGPEKILAVAFSSSGEYLALTDDSKRLVLFKTSPSWEKIRVWWLSRRSTALVFSPCDRRVLVADKSGDVFSFSVEAAREHGRLELGHLSMLLDLVATLDGRHIITCDRDEKIRVSQWGAPHIITAFCLGHTEFVSQLALPAGREELLLSGSGDGTLRLWRYTTGQELDNCRISSIARPEDALEGKGFAVSRICCCPRGEQVAVLCDGVPGIYVFWISPVPRLARPLYVSLSYVPVDLDFEDSTSLWVFSAIKANPIEVLHYREQRWQRAPRDDRMKELSEVIGESWEQMAGSATLENRFSALYKAVFDNMASYLQKKEVRIQTEKRKLSTGLEGSASKIQKV